MSSVLLHPATALAEAPRRQFAAELLVRCVLVVAAVVACYALDWRWLRHLTMVLNTRLDLLAGVHMQAITDDTVLWHGAMYRYVIACTFADVWCGAVPLLWDQRRHVRHNLSLLLAFTAGLLAFNIFRLSVSDFLVAAGMSWDLGHNVVSGISYFLIWSWLLRYGAIGRLWPFSTQAQPAAEKLPQPAEAQ